jgi:hypothetical protein
MNAHFNTAAFDGFGTQAQPLGVTRWIDASGQPMYEYRLEPSGLRFCINAVSLRKNV